MNDAGANLNRCVVYFWLVRCVTRSWWHLRRKMWIGKSHTIQKWSERRKKLTWENTVNISFEICILNKGVVVFVSCERVLSQAHVRETEEKKIILNFAFRITSSFFPEKNSVLKICVSFLCSTWSKKSVFSSIWSFCMRRFNLRQVTIIEQVSVRVPPWATQTNTARLTWTTFQNHRLSFSDYYRTRECHKR